MSGNYLQPELRHLIYLYWHELKKSPSEIHEDLFFGDDTVFTLKRIRDLCNWFSNAKTSSEEINNYICGLNSKKRTVGRKRLMNEEEKAYLKWLLRQRSNRHVKDLKKELYDIIDMEYYSNPSLRTIYREIHLMGISRKVCRSSVFINLKNNIFVIPFNISS
jgi:hypothetical protein